MSQLPFNVTSVNPLTFDLGRSTVLSLEDSEDLVVGEFEGTLIVASPNIPLIFFRPDSKLGVFPYIIEEWEKKDVSILVSTFNKIDKGNIDLSNIDGLEKDLTLFLWRVKNNIYVLYKDKRVNEALTVIQQATVIAYELHSKTDAYTIDANAMKLICDIRCEFYAAELAILRLEGNMKAYNALYSGLMDPSISGLDVGNNFKKVMESIISEFAKQLSE